MLHPHDAHDVSVLRPRDTCDTRITPSIPTSTIDTRDPHPRHISVSATHADVTHCVRASHVRYMTRDHVRDPLVGITNHNSQPPLTLNADSARGADVLRRRAWGVDTPRRRRASSVERGARAVHQINADSNPRLFEEK